MEEAMRLFLEWYEEDRTVADPTDAEVGALAKTLCTAYYSGAWTAAARAAYAHIGAEVARLREELEQDRADRQTRPMKVRFPDVEEINGHLIENNFSTTKHIEMEEALRFAASRAVIDLPADVPSAEDIVTELVAFWGGYSISPDRNDFGTVVRHILSRLAPWLQPRTITAEQVEQAARAAHAYTHEGWNTEWEGETKEYQGKWLARIRNIFAAAGFEIERPDNA